MNDIHPSAIIDDGAALGDNIYIGPFCTIGPQCQLGDGVRLESHIVISGNTQIGARTHIYPFACLGHQPQDLKYRGEENRLEIGADNVIREYVTMHPGTLAGDGLTRVGAHGLFMGGVHVAHDCHIGDHCILSQYAGLAGHVRLGDHVTIGGIVGVQQYSRIGSHAMISALTGVRHDIIPFTIAIGDRAELSGINRVGLKRRNFSADAINRIKEAYHFLFNSNKGDTLRDRAVALKKNYPDDKNICHLADFVLEGERSFHLPRPRTGGAELASAAENAESDTKD